MSGGSMLLTALQSMDLLPDKPASDLTDAELREMVMKVCKCAECRRGNMCEDAAASLPLVTELRDASRESDEVARMQDAIAEMAGEMGMDGITIGEGDEAIVIEAKRQEDVALEGHGDRCEVGDHVEVFYNGESEGQGELMMCTRYGDSAEYHVLVLYDRDREEYAKGNRSGSSMMTGNPDGSKAWTRTFKKLP